MYTIISFGEMINDVSRTKAYADSLQSIVRNDSIVLDIGAGTGIFSILACKFGAKKVYCVEPSPVINLAKTTIEENGYSDKVIFINDYSYNISLQDRATIIISDLRGCLPFFGQHLPSIIDARKRHLATDGVLIAKQDDIWSVPVQSDSLNDRYSNPWINIFKDLKLDAALTYVKNSLWVAPGDHEIQLSSPKLLGTLNYPSINNENFEGNATWQVKISEAICHGFRVWFNTHVYDDILISNAPDEPEHVYSSVLFPLSEPVEMECEDIIEMNFKANLVGNEYIWSWETKIYNKENPGQVKVNYNQSSFNSVPISLELLGKRAANYKSELNINGLIDYEILNLINSGTSIINIAKHISDKFPDKFPDLENTFSYVGELSAKYSK